MNVSLNRLLQTGCLGEIGQGLSKEEVQTLLGLPDTTGGTSRKYPVPCICLYGTVEFWFRQQRPCDLTSIWWEAGGKGLFRLTSGCVIEDWAFIPDWTFAQVEDFLREHEITFDYYDSPNSESQVPDIITASGISISFADGRIYGLHGWK